MRSGPQTRKYFFKNFFSNHCRIRGGDPWKHQSVTLGLLWSELSPGQLCDPGRVSPLILRGKYALSTWGSQKHGEKRRMQKRGNMLCNTWQLKYVLISTHTNRIE